MRFLQRLALCARRRKLLCADTTTAGRRCRVLRSLLWLSDGAKITWDNKSNMHPLSFAAAGRPESLARSPNAMITVALFPDLDDAKLKLDAWGKRQAREGWATG
jgi:hypothetical protein